MKKTWKHIIAGIIVSASLYPLTAHADQGVFLQPYEIKDRNGKIIQSFQKGEEIRFIEGAENSFFVSVDHRKYQIDKSSILKTHDEEEVSITVEEDGGNIRLSPTLFSHTIRSLVQGEVLERMPNSIMNEEYWVQVKTSDGIVGYVYRDSIEIHYKATEIATKAFMINDISKDGKTFEYGQEISLFNWRDGHYVVKDGDVEHLIPESHVSFTKPSKPLILTPSHSYPNQIKVYGNPEFIPPVNMKDPPVSSRYGQRWGKLHAGTDVAIPTGTPLYAVADGVVTRAVKNQTHSKEGWGNYVKIDHGSVDSLYGHMHQLVVNTGQHVKQGELIGYSGNSGHSTGPHLHFEIYKGGVRVDSHYVVHQPELYR